MVSTDDCHGSSVIAERFLLLFFFSFFFFFLSLLIFSFLIFCAF